MQYIPHALLSPSSDREFARLYLCGIGDEFSDFVLDLISHAAKYFCSLFRQSLCGVWVDDAPVPKMEREGENRTSFLGRVTDDDHITETLFYRLRDTFRRLARNVNARFLHDFTCQGIQSAGFDARTRDIKPVAGKRAQKTFGNQAARGAA